MNVFILHEKPTTSVSYLVDDHVAFVDNGEGRADRKKTAKVYRKVKKVLPWGGFTSGYDSDVMINNYKVNPLSGTGFSDPMHY